VDEAPGARWWARGGGARVVAGGSGGGRGRWRAHAVAGRLAAVGRRGWRRRNVAKEQRRKREEERSVRLNPSLAPRSVAPS
jgi:hypothetical protein